MMKYHYRSTQNKARFLTVVCTILFVVYAVLLYLNHQSGIVALSYYIESELVTSTLDITKIWISASLGTLMCIIPAMMLLYWLHFPLRLKAIAFLPSYIVLGILTGISPNTVLSTENEVPVYSSVILLLLSIILIFLSQTYHEDRSEHAPMQNYLASNLFLSCIGMLFCVCLTNSDRQLHVQLEMAEAIHRNDYSVMESMPKGETTSNNTITAMQVLNLSKKGILADQLFSLPYLKGSNSLLPEYAPATKVYHTTTIIYSHLQSVPKGECKEARCFLQSALNGKLTKQQEGKNSSLETSSIKPLVDYYLCALLLDRDLSRFSAELPKYYDVNSTLPYHYREALTLFHSTDSAVTRSYIDVPMDSLYLSYQNIQKEFSDNPSLQRKSCYWAYPYSYWNYYYFGYNNKWELLNK